MTARPDKSLLVKLDVIFKNWKKFLTKMKVTLTYQKKMLSL